MSDRKGDGWLLLIHQIPPRPNYLRVKIGRRLQKIGAVAIKNSVYALPKSEAAQEDLQWTLREITEGGGDGSVCEARFVEGLSDEQVRALFHAARDVEYAAVAQEARALWEKMPADGPAPPKRVAELSAQIVRLRRQLGEVAEIDFLGAPGREAAEGLIGELESHLVKLTSQTKARARKAGGVGTYKKRTWVTRKGVHIDRMACAWLIQRFIDPQARFRFVAAKEYVHKPGEQRFDMFAAEFTHVGDRCTFEVLVERFGLRERPLQAIAEIVHDIDLKDGKFRRQEAAGIDRVILGIAMANEEDAARVSAAATVWDALYEYFGRKRG